jgi:hypothetical protein
LFGRTGKTALEFSGLAGNVDFDGVQAAVLHAKAELFVDFPETVLLEAIGHAQASVRDGPIAMLIAGYFGAMVTSRAKRSPVTFGAYLRLE